MKKHANFDFLTVLGILVKSLFKENGSRDVVSKLVRGEEKFAPLCLGKMFKKNANAKKKRQEKIKLENYLMKYELHSRDAYS